MQISKCWLVIGLAICALAAQGRPGVEKEAQIKARAALEKKLQELGAQPAAVAPDKTPTPPPDVNAPTTNAAPPPVVVPPPAKKPAMQPPPAAQPVMPLAGSRPIPPAVQRAPMPMTPPASAPVVQAPDAQAQAKARMALDQKMRELPEAQPAISASAPATPPAPSAAAPAIQPAAPPTPIAPPIAVAPPARPAVADSTPAQPPTRVRPVPADAASIAKARAAMSDSMAKLPSDADTAVAPGMNPPPSPRWASHGQEVKPVSYPGLEAPPLPISAEKHQRLEQLLQKYKADELSPEQYHAERAKILAEP